MLDVTTDVVPIGVSFFADLLVIQVYSIGGINDGLSAGRKRKNHQSLTSCCK